MLLHAYAPFRQIVESRRCTLKTINARLERRTSTEYAEKSLPFIIRAWFRNIRGILTVITTATNFRCTVSRMRKFIVLSDQPRGTCINAVHVFAVYSREKNLSPTFKTVASVDISVHLLRSSQIRLIFFSQNWSLHSTRLDVGQFPELRATSFQRIAINLRNSPIFQPVSFPRAS